MIPCIFHTQDRIPNIPFLTICGIHQVCQIICLFRTILEVENNFKPYTVLIQLYFFFRNNTITAFYPEYHHPFSCLFHPGTYICIVGLECRNSGCITQLHSMHIQFGFTGTPGKRDPLSQNIPGVHQSFSWIFILQPQPSRSFSQAPCTVIRIMIPLPEQRKPVFRSIKLITSIKLCHTLLRRQLYLQSFFCLTASVFSHQQPSVFPGY